MLTMVFQRKAITRGQEQWVGSPERGGGVRGPLATCVCGGERKVVGNIVKRGNKTHPNSGENRHERDQE